MKTYFFLLFSIFTISISSFSQSFELLPNSGLVRGDTSQFIIGRDTALSSTIQFYGVHGNSDTLIWGARNKGFEANWKLLTEPEKNAYSIDILNTNKPSQFEINLPQGNVSINNWGNVLLGSSILGDTTNLLFDARSNRPGPMITASGVAISSAARVTHTQPDTTYNEVHGLYLHSDSANFVNASLFAETGLSGSVANIGVFGRVYDAPKATSKYIGVLGIDAVNAPNSFAGEFHGKVGVLGDVIINGSIAKSSGTFRIDHPQDPYNKYLNHSFVESPDMMNVYNGNILTGVDSLAEVRLPPYFESLNMDFRYQLTVIGQFAQAIIFETISSNQFTIKTDKPNVQVSWMVTGIRKDAYANDHRVVPEQLKPANEQGTLLYTPLGGGTLSVGGTLPNSTYRN